MNGTFIECLDEMCVVISGINNTEQMFVCVIVLWCSLVFCA